MIPLERLAYSSEHLTTYQRPIQMNGIQTNNPAQVWQLPVPEKSAREHSQRLAGLIREQMAKNGGRISFERYMEMALYEPGWGYYSAGAARFDAAGDFITAPHVSPLFSRCIARQCGQVLASLPSGDILELGAGSGVMAKDVLLELASADTFPDNYFILETSADLRMRQKALFEAHVPHLLPRVHWLDSLPEKPVNGVIVANEVIDALPVKRILLDKGTIHEMHVGYRNHGFYWAEEKLEGTVAASFEKIANHLRLSFSKPYLTEVNTRLDAWIKSISAALAQGMILLIDYGYPQREYYHPQRDRGSLLCHYRHRCHEDPFFYPGLQDVTASVDFTALAQAATDNELQVAGYASQAHFLLGCGLEEIALGSPGNGAHLDPAVSRQIKLLTLPGEMGERFKAIAFTRNYAQGLIGFQFIDQRERLWQS